MSTGVVHPAVGPLLPLLPPECLIRRTGDGGHLFRRVLALRQRSALRRFKLQPSVVAVRHHCAKSEERSNAESLRVARVIGCEGSGQQVENGPYRAEYKLDFKPGDPSEFLHNVEQVEDEQDPREPEAAHGHGIEPSSPAVAAECRHRYAYKSQEIQYHLHDLQHARQCPRIRRIEPYIGLSRRGGGRHGGRGGVLPRESLIHRLRLL